MPIEVSAVNGFSDLREFVALPFRLHAGTPWIPPLKLERYAFLTRKLNAVLHATARPSTSWPAASGVVVGRITAQIDYAFNEYHDSRWGMFGFLEFEDDPEMLARAARRRRRRGCAGAAASGWSGRWTSRSTTRPGVLIEGFEREPLIREPWNPPYYRRRCEEAGPDQGDGPVRLGPEHHRPRADEPDPAPGRRARARTRYGITIRKMSRRHLRREMDEFAKVYNAAWSDNWGFVPYSKADLDAYAIDMQLVYSRDWFMIAEQEGKTIAMAITIPDIHQVYKKMQGRLLPLGWWYYLNRDRIIDRVRVGFLGVLPEYQHTGVAAALYLEHFDAASADARQKAARRASSSRSTRP